MEPTQTKKSPPEYLARETNMFTLELQTRNSTWSSIEFELPVNIASNRLAIFVSTAILTLHVWDGFYTLINKYISQHNYTAELVEIAYNSGPLQLLSRREKFLSHYNLQQDQKLLLTSRAKQKSFLVAIAYFVQRLMFFLSISSYD